MQQADKTVLDDCVLQCCRDTLDACSILAERCAVPPPQIAGVEQAASFIGFSGKLLRGTLTLVASMALLRAAHPVRRRKEILTEAEVLDWSAELANLLLGRVTNRLADLGAELHPSTPKAMRASDLRMSSSPRTSICSFGFESEAGAIGVWLDGVASTESRLFAAEPCPPSALPEGDIVLF